MFRWLLWTVMLWIVFAPTVATAQSAGSSPDHMCGDGTTFSVHLPGVPGTLPVGLDVPDDVVTLPNGCSIYAILVSGYSVNPLLNLLSFYKLAQHVATRNGYVHYSWWNNFMGEYLTRPLHGAGLPLQVKLPNGELDTIRLTPGRLAVNIVGFAPVDFDDEFTFKAVPEEDTQFQQDARLVIKAIRQHNPNALIIVAGHSMGGAAVVRLGATPDVPIDLLAPIDPVGNRSTPVGLKIGETYNWTRWRVANDLRGYRQVDCVRDGLLCKDFDPRLFRFAYRCEAVGPLLSNPPLIFSKAPLVCPRLTPYRQMGPRPVIGSNVRMLYHRWQNEFPFPFDVFDHEVINRGPLTGLLGGNYQQPVLKNTVGESDPNKTCGLSGGLNLAVLVAQMLIPGFLLPPIGAQPGDPRDPNLFCTPFDGHGEIVGMRSKIAGALAPDWPCYTGVRNSHADDACAASPTETRRDKLVDLAQSSLPPHPGKTVADEDQALRQWIHEPPNPHLDMVANDLVAIVEHLRADAPGDPDTTAPETAAAVNPAANDDGWHAQDVLVDLLANDVGGSGVENIEYSVSGAQSIGPIVTPGAAAQATIGTEGLSTVTFGARDRAGNVETPRELVVRLDRTPPDISAELSVEPNSAGWIRSAVTVTFHATDALSGVQQVTDPVTFATEGAAQEVIGTAVDVAGNDAGAAAVVNLDFTPPQINLQVPATNAVYLLNEAISAQYDCTDLLSGLRSCAGSVANGAAIDTTSVGSKTLSVQAADHADNVAEAAHTYSVHYGFSGFHKPLAADGTLNLANGGRVVPIKYTLRDAAGAVVSDLASFVSLQSSLATCEGDQSTETVDAEASGSSTIRFDPDNLQFVYNWATAKEWAGTCRSLELTLSDGSQHTALFRFR